MSEQAPTNIGPKGRRQRMAMALVFGLVLLGGIVWVATSSPAPALRWLLAIPLFVAALGFFQARAGT